MRWTIPRQHQLSTAYQKRKMSSGKKTKHIKAKFFFVKDRVGNGEIKVIDCPTKEMWANIMTKLLQGTAFRVMRTELMNCPVNCEDPGEKKKMAVKLHPISSAPKMVWKSVVATPIKTAQECVGQNWTCLNKPRIDRQLGRTKFPRGKHSRGMGVGPQIGTNSIEVEGNW